MERIKEAAKAYAAGYRKAALAGEEPEAALAAAFVAGALWMTEDRVGKDRDPLKSRPRRARGGKRRVA